jgi:hypothetical protein
VSVVLLTIDPVATTHFFSESLKKAPKSTRPDALLKTSLSSPDVSKAVTSPESPTPKLNGGETVLSFSKNVLDKNKPRLQTVDEHTRTEAKMLIQTMRDKCLQLLGKSCSDINDHKILENVDSSEAELKGYSDQNAYLVGVVRLLIIYNVIPLRQLRTMNQRMRWLMKSKFLVMKLRSALMNNWYSYFVK